MRPQHAPNPDILELHKLEQEKPQTHLNPYYWKFTWDGRPCRVGMTDFEKKREEPGAPKRRGADGRIKKEPGKRRTGQEHLYAEGDAMATAAVIKLLLDWLLPLGLVYETALLPPHMRYSRISEPTREVFRIPLPGSQWAQRASGSTEAPAGGAATSQGAAEPVPPPIKRLMGESSTAAATHPAIWRQSLSMEVGWRPSPSSASPVASLAQA